MNASTDFSFDEKAADEAAETMMESAPEISEHAIAQFEEKQQQTDDNVERDIDGVPFDATIHTGTKLKNGKWRTRKTPRSIVGTSRSRVAGIGNSAAPASDPESDKRAAMDAQCRAAGVAAAATLVTVGQMFGGEEWAPRKNPVDEMEMLGTAFGDYFVAKGVSDFPPGVALCLAIGMYAAPRFTMPQTRTRMQRFKSWVSLKIAKRKLVRALRNAGVENAVVTIEDGALYINGQPAESFSVK